MKITLTVKQIHDLANFAEEQELPGGDGETEITIELLEGKASGAGEPMPDGIYAWVTEYPEEYVHGPLGE